MTLSRESGKVLNVNLTTPLLLLAEPKLVEPQV